MNISINIFIALTLLIYSAIYFIDQLLKSCLNVPYMTFVEHFGITIKPFKISIYTTWFNRTITKWASNGNQFFKMWFSFGAFLVMLLLLPSFLLLIYFAVMQLSFNYGAKNQSGLNIALPGWNIPTDEIFLYFIALLFTSVFHEIGHALAAVKEGIHINGFGFLFLLVFPAAYVDIPAESLKKLTQFKRLKVLCAGVWHNVIISTSAYLLGILLPFLLSFLYRTGEGITVVDLTPDSPLYGATGLKIGDIVTHINLVSLTSLESWKMRILEIAINEQIGFCVGESYINEYDETLHHVLRPDNTVECCRHNSDTHLCFELKTNSDEDLGESPMHPYSCLPARTVIANSDQTCFSTSVCPQQSFCLVPSLQNSSKLVLLNRKIYDDTPQDVVLYLGHPAYLYRTVYFSKFVPRMGFISSYLPYRFEILLDYFLKFSAAMAVLNLIPCIYLDGYWISETLVELLLHSRTSILTKKVIHCIIIIFGTFVLFINVGAAFVNLIH